MTWQPKTLSEVIGQEKVKEVLRVCVDASNKTGQSFSHTIFQGPPGLGKSTFGNILAEELGVYCSHINGATISTQEPIIKALVKSKDRDIVFIDEIHSMPVKILEMLYMPIEQKYLLFQEKNKFTKESSSIKLPLKNFTLIAATTNAGLLPKPLYDRMALKLFLEYYSDQEICRILEKCLEHLSSSPDVLLSIAKRCRGIPRVAKSLSEWLSNYCVSKNTTSLTGDLVKRAFEVYSIDESGLDHNDRLYIAALEKQSGPIGIKAISSLTGIPEATITDHIEPHLLNLNLITKTKTGRILSSNSQESEIERALRQLRDDLG